MNELKPDFFDPVLHSGPRIAIVSRLVIHRVMRFAALQRSTTLTAGNLAAHLEVLAKAGYVALQTDERKVERWKAVQITSEGDAAFRAYVQKARAMLDVMQANLDENQMAK